MDNRRQHCIFTNWNLRLTYTAWKVSKYGVFSGPYFPAFGLNTERYEISLRIQSECGKIQTRKNSVFGHISYSVNPIHIVPVADSCLLWEHQRSWESEIFREFLKFIKVFGFKNFFLDLKLLGDRIYKTKTTEQIEDHNFL